MKNKLNKKQIIAIVVSVVVLVAIIVGVIVYANSKKDDDGKYKDDLVSGEYVTDESGEKVTDENGNFLISEEVTDDKGNTVTEQYTDSDGKTHYRPVTTIRPEDDSSNSNSNSDNNSDENGNSQNENTSDNTTKPAVTEKPHTIKITVKLPSVYENEEKKEFAKDTLIAEDTTNSKELEKKSVKLDGKTVTLKVKVSGKGKLTLKLKNLEAKASEIYNSEVKEMELELVDPETTKQNNIGVIVGKDD